MSQSDEERTAQPSMLVRADEIQQQIQQLSGRDLQLWSIGILVMLVLTSGLLAVILPNLVWSQLFVHIDRFYLPQLFFGLISLVLLFNIYLLSQKRTLNSTRLALIRELVLNERLESLSLIDPLTQLLNRRALNELLPREVARANPLVDFHRVVSPCVFEQQGCCSMSTLLRLATRVWFTKEFPNQFGWCGRSAD